MKILYLHQYFRLYGRSYYMAKQLVKAGHDVTIVCGKQDLKKKDLRQQYSNKQKTSKVNGIQVIELNLKYSNKLNFTQRIIVFFKYTLQSTIIALTKNYSIIIATSTPLTIAIPGILARWFRGKIFILEIRDLWPELPKAMKVITNPILILVMEILEWVSYHSANRLIGLSPGIVKGIKKRGIKKNLITLIPNMSDIEFFQNISSKKIFKKINNFFFIALFAGTHGIASGLDAIINVAKILKKKNYDKIKFLLVGDGKLKNDLKKQAKKEKLNNIIFINQKSKKKIAEIMLSVDIGMQLLKNIPAFYYGTSPNKFFDYLAAGLPVISNYPGWLANMIKKYKCGYVVKPDNPKIFANILIKLSKNKNQLTKLGRNAKKLALLNFNKNELSDKFVKWVVK